MRSSSQNVSSDLLAEGQRSGEGLAGFAAQFAEYWDDHLRTAREWIRAGILGLSNRRVVTILGAGACRDIPLADLVQAFETVHLVDIDATGLQSAVDSLRNDPLTQSLVERVHCHLSDVTGGELDRLVNESASVLGEASDIGTALEKLAGVFLTAAQSPVPELSHNLRADYVVSSGVTSQFLPLVKAAVRDRIRRRYPDARADQVRLESLRAAEGQLLKNWLRHHTSLLGSLCKPGGRVFWLDTVAEAPFWGNLAGPELIATLREVYAYLQSAPFPAFATPVVQGALHNARTPDQFLAVPSQLIRTKRISVDQGKQLIDTIQTLVLRRCPQAKLETIPGGLSAYCDGRFVPLGPTRTWQWYLKPVELATLSVEAELYEIRS